MLKIVGSIKTFTNNHISSRNSTVENIPTNGPKKSSNSNTQNITSSKTLTKRSNINVIDSATLRDSNNCLHLPADLSVYSGGDGIYYVPSPKVVIEGIKPVIVWIKGKKCEGVNLIVNKKPLLNAFDTTIFIGEEKYILKSLTTYTFDAPLREKTVTKTIEGKTYDFRTIFPLPENRTITYKREGQKDSPSITFCFNVGK